MSSCLNVLTTLALLYTCIQAEDVMTYSKEYIAYNDDGITLAKPYADRFLYVTCKNFLSINRYCNVTVEMTSDTRKECPLDPGFNYVATLELMNDKVVFQPRDLIGGHRNASKKINIVNMDDCSKLDLDFPYDDGYNWTEYQYQLVVYNDSFNVYVINNPALCGNYAKCILKYNYNGERVGEPINLPSNYKYHHVVPVNRFHPKKGVYVLGLDVESPSDVVYAIHVNDMGFETNLFNFTTTFSSPRNYVVKYSNEYGYFTACYRFKYEDTEIRCLQYDTTGYKMMNATMEMAWREHMVGVYNLRQGGVVFLSYGCIGNPGCTTVRAKMVDTNGKVVKEIQVPEIGRQCNAPANDLDVRHMETANEHCFFLACTHSQPAQHRHSSNRLRMRPRVSQYLANTSSVLASNNTIVEKTKRHVPNPMIRSHPAIRTKTRFNYIRKCMDKKTYF